MKTIFRILFLGLLSAGTLLAQDMAYYDSAKASAPGYWEVSTDYRSNGTAIRYYNPDQQLIHQELLPNQLVKLTKNNVRRLNATLTKISLQQKEPSNVKTVALPIDNEDSRMARTRRKRMDAERKASPEDLLVRVVPGSEGTDAVLKLFIYNPHEERLRIDILNSKGYTVCQEYNRNFQQYYRFNLNSMPSGNYRVQIFKASEKVPASDNTISLSRKPSQTVFSMRAEISSATNGDSLASDKE